MGNPISPDKRKKIDNSAEFHRAMRKKREKNPPAPEITPAPGKIGEGKDNLNRRSDWFKKRTGNPKP